MNKKLYLEWLKNKANDTPIDGPNKLNESRSQVRFMRSVIASLLQRDREEARQRAKEEPDTVSIEPRSSLVDLNLPKKDPSRSITTPQSAPAWSYNVRNMMGLGSNSVYEETIDENAIVLAKPIAGLAKPIAGNVLAKTSVPAARGIVPAARRIGSNPNAITTVPTRRIDYNPNAINVLAKPPVPAARRVGTRMNVPNPLAKTRPGNLARRTGTRSNQLAKPIRQTGSQLGRPIAGQANPLGTQMPRAATRVIPQVTDTGEEDQGSKTIAPNTPMGAIGKGSSRKASNTTRSIHLRGNPYSAVTLEPETGKVEGGEQANSMYEQEVKSGLPKPSSGRVRTGNPKSTTGSAIGRLTKIPLRLEETSMSSLINNHIEKFLKSRHGQKLKTEAESVLTKKD